VKIINNGGEIAAKSESGGENGWRSEKRHGNVAALMKA
jgi:hypothetical protein